VAVEVKDHAFLTLEIEEIVSSPWEKNHVFVGIVVPRDILDVAVKRISNITARNKTLAIHSIARGLIASVFIVSACWRLHIFCLIDVSLHCHIIFFLLKMKFYSVYCRRVVLHVRPMSKDCVHK
jgi:hypothetical protein